MAILFETNMKNEFHKVFQDPVFYSNFVVNKMFLVEDVKLNHF